MGRGHVRRLHDGLVVRGVARRVRAGARGEHRPVRALGAHGHARPVGSVPARHRARGARRGEHRAPSAGPGCGRHRVRAGRRGTGGRGAPRARRIRAAAVGNPARLHPVARRPRHDTRPSRARGRGHRLPARGRHPARHGPRVPARARGPGAVGPRRPGGVVVDHPRSRGPRPAGRGARAPLGARRDGPGAAVRARGRRGHYGRRDRPGHPSRGFTGHGGPRFWTSRTAAPRGSRARRRRDPRVGQHTPRALLGHDRAQP